MAKTILVVNDKRELRVFLGEPGGPEATKTTIEPGNAFSPGMYSFGVTWWLRFPGRDFFFAPELAPLETLHWSYARGYVPPIHCEAHVEGIHVRHSLLADGNASERSEAVSARLQLTNQHGAANSVELYVVLRSLGPAGGPLSSLRIGDEGRVVADGRNTNVLLAFDQSPSAVGCGVGDPSPVARAGLVPAEQESTDEAGWCYALAKYDLQLEPGAVWTVHLDCPIPTHGNLAPELAGTAIPRPSQFTARAQCVSDGWQSRLSTVALDVPDDNFRNAFFAGMQHMLTALVGDQARIAPLAYPLPWLRDSIFIIRCFDLAGQHELARAATEYCVRNDFFGGFSAEGDAPGQGIWALVEHYRITRDLDWLASVYPAIERKVDWLFRMRRTTEPIQIVPDTPVLPFMNAARFAGTICVEAKHGIIHGMMDHGIEYALGWVNHWALCGLAEAAYAATELGFNEDAERYVQEATELRTALNEFADQTPAFYEWERTVNSLLWPTRAWESSPETIVDGFDRWWVENRGDETDYRPEKYWLYFELAQAHNALLMGQRERAWQVVEYRLQHQDLPGLYGWREGGDGVGTRNAVHGVTLVGQLRGCQHYDSITPHGWSQSEMWLLQRAMLVEEWQDGLLLFAGVPRHWLTPGARIAIERFPTWYGDVCATLQVDAGGETATITLEGVQDGTLIRLRLPGASQDVRAVDGALRVGVVLF